MSEKRNAWAERRGNKYLGRYRDKDGKTKSVGVHPDKEQALAAAQRRFSLGEAGDFLDMTLEEYLLHWRDSHLGEEKTSPNQKQAHYLTLSKYILKGYGRKRIREFETNPWLAHQVIGSVLSHPRARKTSQRRVRMALGSAFRPLVKMQLLRMNPTTGVEVASAPRSRQPIFKPEEFAAIVEAMEYPAQKACLKFMLYSAMRPGEVFALRVSDIRFRPNGMAFIQQARKIVMPVSGAQPEAVEEDGSKTGEGHLVKLSPRQAQVLRDHIEAEGLSGDDLVFPRSLVAPARPRPHKEWDPEGDYGIYDDGVRRARHGTTTAYTYGCKCEHCKAAYALYRRTTSASRQKRIPRPQASDDYMTSRRWHPIFKAAVGRAGVEWDGKAYTTRAAAATWMFKAGAELPDVQEALNHKNPATTLIYLRAAKQEEDETVNAALDSVV